MDEAALEELGAQRIDWRFKGFPAAFDGMTAAQLADAKPSLAAFATPLLVLDARALEHNLVTMARYCADHSVDLAPHGKTTMAPQLFARQIAAGAWGITVATIAQARVCRAFGVGTIVLANELVDPDALGWIAEQLRQDPGFRFLCFADSAVSVEAMQSVLAEHDASRPIEVLIDVGAPGGRTGCRDLDQADAVAQAVRASDRLLLAGVAGYEGVLANDRSPASLERIRAYLGTMRELVARLDERGLFDNVEEIVVTAGGSAYFDEVVEVLGESWRTSRPVRTVLRSGAYVSHDDGHYRVLTPFTSDQPGPGPFQAALHVLGRVLSLPEPGLALLDFGKRDAPVDLGLPEPQEIRHADGRRSSAKGYRITALADQHAFLNSDPADDAATALSIGDIVVCGISHPCTAFDKWQLIPVVEDGHVVDLIRTFF
jgi:D-serine deaminase-like pyridoxal phosphate-dependent protein